jgi:hypothetical protein
MSYDITIKSNDGYSQYAGLQEFNKIIGDMDGIAGKERHFNYEDSTGGRFEIDVSMVRAGGELQDEHSNRFNAIAIHIPAVFFESSEKKALEVSRVFADRLKWKIFDEQSGIYLGPGVETLTAVPHSGRDRHGVWGQVMKAWFAFMRDALKGKAGVKVLVPVLLIVLSLLILLTGLVLHVIIPFFRWLLGIFIS